MKAVPGEQTQRVPPCGTAPRDSLQLKETNHETLTKITLAVALLATAANSHAEWVNGYFRSSGSYVNPHYRTPANDTPYDNLSYRSYPSQQPGYVSPRTYDSGTIRPLPSFESDQIVRPLRRSVYGW